MAKRHLALEYPVIIKQHLGFIVFSVPDLGINLVENLPVGGKLSRSYVIQLAASLGKTWIKSSERLRAFKDAGKPPPEPSSIKATLSERQDLGFTPPQAAKLLGVSVNTVRRMVDRGTLKAEVTDGGHRKICEREIRTWLELNAETFNNTQSTK